MKKLVTVPVPGPVTVTEKMTINKSTDKWADGFRRSGVQPRSQGWIEGCMLRCEGTVRGGGWGWGNMGVGMGWRVEMGIGSGVEGVGVVRAKGGGWRVGLGAEGWDSLIGLGNQKASLKM